MASVQQQAGPGATAVEVRAAVELLVASAAPRRRPDSGGGPTASSAVLGKRGKAGSVRTTWRVTVAYDGAAFAGFARQPPPLATVEATLHDAWLELLDGASSLKVECAGRTDKGVSATGQVVSFHTWCSDVTPHRLAEEAARAGPWPGALRVVAAERAPPTFHAAFSATWRRYAFLWPLAGGDGPAVDVGRVDRLLRSLEGRAVDFDAFARDVNRPGKTECTVHLARAREVTLPGSGARAMQVDLCFDRFLRRLCRVLLATAVREAAVPDSPDEVLLRLAAAGERRGTAPAVPGDGLMLVDVGYDEAPPCE